MCRVRHFLPVVVTARWVPMKRLSSTPYALNAGMLGGLTASGFIKNHHATNRQYRRAKRERWQCQTVIQAAPSQTANLLDLRDSGGPGVPHSMHRQSTLTGRIAGSGTVTRANLYCYYGTTRQRFWFGVCSQVRHRQPYGCDFLIRRYQTTPSVCKQR